MRFNKNERPFIIMLKRLAASALLICLLAALPCAGSALHGLDIIDPTGLRFENVSAPYMTEGGKPSRTEFFTDADIAQSRITVINLWDSACLFCRLELPYFQQASLDYADRGVGFCGSVGTRMGGTYEAAYGYLQEYGVTYVNVIPDESMQSILFLNAGNPQTFFVDGSGTVLAHVADDMTYEELSEMLESLLNFYGDADCNGVLNFADISSMYVFMLGSADIGAQGAVNADFNRDGAVSFGDISGLYLYIIGG